MVAEQHKWHLRKVYTLEEQQAVSAKLSLVHCYREMWMWVLRTCIAGLQTMNGSCAWTDDMRVSLCAHPHPCQTPGCSFCMIYKRVCSHHTDLAHDLGAYSGLLHLTWVHKDKCVLRWLEALKGLTAIGLCVKKASGSIRSLCHMLVQNEHAGISFQHWLMNLGTLSILKTILG